MTFQPDPNAIVWRLRLSSSPDRVYEVIDSDDGRAAFWAESAIESEGVIAFEFVNGMRYTGRITERVPHREWTVDYFGSEATFVLEPDGSGGTDLTLINRGVPETDRGEVTAGWLNVLLPVKAWTDFGVDLRSHDPDRTWDQGYVDQ